MTRERVRTPPLNSLRVFEAVARLGSFKSAAEELNVTPAAVSFQIRQLEQDLKTKLFERESHGVSLSQAGAALYPKLAEGFRPVAEAVQAFQAERTRDLIRVTAGPAVTTKWLALRMPEFRQLEPDVEVDIDAGLDVVDLDRGPIDFALRFGNVPAGKAARTQLVEEVVVPAAAPALCERLRGPEDLAKAGLIHDRSLVLVRPEAPTWQSWFRTADLPEGIGGHGITFNQSDHAIQAAIDGAGVALARVILAGPDIRAGRLAIPFGPTLPTGLHYYLLEQRQRPHRASLGAFRDWIVEGLGADFCALIAEVEALVETQAGRDV